MQKSAAWRWRRIISPFSIGCQIIAVFAGKALSTINCGARVKRLTDEAVLIGIMNTTEHSNWATLACLRIYFGGCKGRPV
jgi:hypothetical protein